MRRRIIAALTAALLSVGLALFGSAGTASAEAFPAGWSDYPSTTSTLDLASYKVVVTLQLFRSAASNDYSTVTAVQTRCAIRKQGSTTGVRIDSCRLGIWGGALLRSDGPFYDNGTCCANGTSGFRYADNNGSTTFLGRIYYSWRSGGVLFSDYWTADPSDPFWRLT